MDNSYPPYILRRAKFVLEEASNVDRTRDFTVNMALRVISNWVTVGKNGTSYAVKRANTRMSRAARELRSIGAYGEWHKKTTNEHPEELSIVWQWICDNVGVLRPEDLCRRLSEHPFVTVTLEESARLRKLSKSSFATPVERYRIANIEIVNFAPEDVGNDHR